MGGGTPTLFLKYKGALHLPSALSSLGEAPYLFPRAVLLQGHAHLSSAIRSQVLRLSEEESSSIVFCVPTILDPSLLDLTLGEIPTSESGRMSL